MLIHFIYQWNPFNIYGLRVDDEDLIHEPLSSNETLMQDALGHCRRIKIPSRESNFLEKIVFWFQIHLNKKGHLEAIDKLLSLFYEKVLLDPPEETDKLQKINEQVNQLRSLKNDYNFVFLKKGDSSFIDKRLTEITQHAYSIFSYYFKQQVFKQEKLRQIEFSSFHDEIKKNLLLLSKEYELGLIKARFFMIVPEKFISILLKERVSSLDKRSQNIKKLFLQINEIEKKFSGTFTISDLNDWMARFRTQVQREMEKIGIELEVLLMSLIIRYHLVPCQQLKKILKLIDIELDQIERKRIPILFQETLESEIQRMQSIFLHKEFLQAE